MGKVYSRTVRGLSIPASTPRVFALEFPHECSITKLHVRQMTGTAVAFTVDVLSRPSGGYVAGPEAGGAIGVKEHLNGGTPIITAAGPAHIDLYKVITTINGSSGGSASLLSDTGWKYNPDTDQAVNHVQYVFIRINPTAAAGVTTWELSLAAEILSAY